jgi:hypothetical protein
MRMFGGISSQSRLVNKMTQTGDKVLDIQLWERAGLGKRVNRKSRLARRVQRIPVALEPWGMCAVLALEP